MRAQARAEGFHRDVFPVRRQRCDAGAWRHRTRIAALVQKHRQRYTNRSIVALSIGYDIMFPFNGYINV